MNHKDLEIQFGDLFFLNSIECDLILKNLNNIEIWNHENIEKELKKTISDLNISFKNFAQPIRCLILGEKNGPSISDIIYIVGKRNFIDMIENL